MPIPLSLTIISIRLIVEREAITAIVGSRFASSLLYLIALLTKLFSMRPRIWRSVSIRVDWSAGAT